MPKGNADSENTWDHLRFTPQAGPKKETIYNKQK